ncbi:hypothetical protein [Geomicrobium sp. JCM 19039]|uniref:hypothetical protein n=1 Tax=Geomicrobium sp. JCM 19039 TaxID=1460636 RepID=UPI00126904BA|nr:hypothetical protein [Geomicrobium sp. JCM 19039]
MPKKNHKVFGIPRADVMLAFVTEKSNGISYAERIGDKNLMQHNHLKNQRISLVHRIFSSSQSHKTNGSLSVFAPALNGGIIDFDRLLLSQKTGGIANSSVEFLIKQYFCTLCDSVITCCSFFG